MEGSEAIAEAAIAAGCRFFSGYPMTPFTEVLECLFRLTSVQQSPALIGMGICVVRIIS